MAPVSLYTHWVQGYLVHEFAALQHRAPVNRWPDVQTHWVHLNQGGGGGPDAPRSRLRRHHRTCENFLENQKPNGYT